MDRRALVAALALAAACGKSKEAQRFDQFRAMCASLANQATTYQGAVTLFEGNPVGAFEPFADCPGNLLPLPSGDTCRQDGSECRAFFASYVNDTADCSPLGCFFGCEIRMNLAPGAGGSLPDPSTPICGVRFYSGQPCPFGCF